MIEIRSQSSPRFAFFGTPFLATVFLDDLEKAGLVPSIVVTTPDRRQGRGMELTPPPVKKWAGQRGIEVMQAEELDESCIANIRDTKLDLGVVIYYGKLIPRAIFEAPKYGILNVHFSLLPRWRGTSPVRAALANGDTETGTSIILLDEELDHGPIVAQKKMPLPSDPPRASALEEHLTHESAKLLADILPGWLRGEIEPQGQHHDLATYCPAFEKEDGKIDLSGDAHENLRKIRAFDTTVGTYAMFERGGKEIRVRILDAHLENGKLIIDTVKPEGKRDMQYQEFLRSGAKPM